MRARLGLFSLAVTVVGWFAVVPWIDAVAATTKVGYVVYCPVIAVAVWMFFLVGLRIRRWMSGSSYVLLGIGWVLTGWIPTYFLAVALTSCIVALASSSAYLALIPVGLPVADMCGASVVVGTLGFAVMLLRDAARFLRGRAV